MTENAVSVWNANPKWIKKDAFSKISGYVWTGPQSHVQSFGKVLKAFQNFLRLGKFILFIFQDGVIWVYWDFLFFMNCVVQELAMAPKSKQRRK